MTSKYPELNNWDLEQDKNSYEILLDQQRAQLAFLNSEEERIRTAKQLCLSGILSTRRKLLEIDRNLK